MGILTLTPKKILTRVAVCEEGADGEEDLGDGERGAPVVLEDIEADDAVTVDVAVVDARAEGHLDRASRARFRYHFHTG